MASASRSPLGRSTRRRPETDGKSNGAIVVGGGGVGQQRRQQPEQDYERPGMRILRVVGAQYKATSRVEEWVEMAEAKVKVRTDVSCETYHPLGRVISC